MKVFLIKTTQLSLTGSFQKHAEALAGLSFEAAEAFEKIQNKATKERNRRVCPTN